MCKNINKHTVCTKKINLNVKLKLIGCGMIISKSVKKL